MININVYKVIDKEDIFMSMFGMEDMIFSADTIHRAFEQHPDEQDFRLNINCDGGLVSEGLRIYDVLRTSGKTLHTNIEGACHSMAVTLLLAAPKENRTANPNARALIHEVRGGSWDSLTSTELRTLANEIDTEQNALLDIYADRTEYNREELETLMKEEKMRTSQELLNYGFISKINTYSTNKKNEQMEKPNLSAAEKLIRSIKNLLNPEEAPEVVNYDFKDADDVVLFSTEKEDDSLEVGDKASPDGEFVIADGRTVTILDGEITTIADAVVIDNEKVELQNQITELQAQLTASRNEMEQSKEALTNSLGVMEDLRNQITSNYKAAERLSQPVKKNVDGVKSADEIKNELKEKVNLNKGGKQ